MKSPRRIEKVEKEIEKVGILVILGVHENCSKSLSRND